MTGPSSPWASPTACTSRSAPAIAAQGPTSRSVNLPVCVDAKDDPVKDCSMHVTTPRAGTVNTDPATPADYQGAILTWVHARLADA